MPATRLDPLAAPASPPSGTAMHDANRRGILAMVASMAAFVANDTCVKLASATLPIGEIITLRNGVATLVIATYLARAGAVTLPPSLPRLLLALRITGELVSTVLFLVALVSLPLADMTAIAQFTPLALTAGAAIFLHEPVGWRRWTAAAVGLFGVSLIVRPGSSAFSPAGLMVFASIAFVVMRDLATRSIPAAVSTPLLTLTSTLAGGVAGLTLLPFETWRVLSQAETALVGAAGVFLAAGYALIIVALRTGEVAVVSPFRYSNILFALLSGYLIWGTTLDSWALLGSAIICAAGLYTVHRERSRRLAAS